MTSRELNSMHRHSLELKLAEEITKIEMNDCIFDEHTIEKNDIEEKLDFELFSEFRKFTMMNELSLNEHSLFCNCKDSKIDNLKIGLTNGSSHKNSNFIVLNSIANRMISEFAYSRLLYYSFRADFAIGPDDIEFANILDHNHIDIYGYRIEYLRVSYRLAYSILDKIGNAILLLYNIKVDSRVYFETLFSTIK